MRAKTLRSLLAALLLAAWFGHGAPAAAQTAAGRSRCGTRRLPESESAHRQPRTGNVLLVVSLYEDRNDPAPRWIEHQTVTLDAGGRYSLQFGGTRAEGLPSDLFIGAAATRWLGVAIDGEPEQPRVPLVSVPFAANAASAETLAGKRLTDFILTSTFREDVRAALQEEGQMVIAAASTLNYLQKGDGAGGTTDSTITETGGTLDVSGTTLTADGVLTIEAGGRITAQAGNDLHIVAPNTRSIFFRIGSPDNPRVEIDNIGRLGLGLSGAPPTALLDASGTTISFDGILSLEPGGKLTTRAGNDLNIDTPANRSLFIRNGGVTKMAMDGAGNVGVGTDAPAAKFHVVGNATVTGNVTVDGNIAAKYQDIAEFVDAAEPLEAGTIVTIDPTASNRVRAARVAYDTAVAGAVSPQPGLVLGEAGEGRVLVAQSGRVRIKVDASFGAIRPGDLLVASPTAGHAMRAQRAKIRPGTLIGKALEALPNGRGEVLALLTLQ
jgi:hypothetical protein